MTKIGINARVLTKPNPTGVSRYTQKLLEALAEREDDFEYILFGTQSVPEPFKGFQTITNAGVVSPVHSGYRAHIWEQTTLPRAINRYDLDVFHTPAGQPPIAARTSLVTTIHDISPVSHPEWFSRGYAALYRFLTPLAVRVSERLLTVSEFARDEIVECFPHAAGKTLVTYNGVTPPIKPGETIDGLTEDQFVLSVGATNPRKNLKTLIQAYQCYRENVSNPADLVLAGPDRDVFASNDLPDISGVRALGFVSDEKLAWLYRNAAALAYPSLYEGFGLPIIEAMHVETPVITSNQGAMAEVAGNAALLTDPNDPDRIAECIERAINDESVSQKLARQGSSRAAEFTWDRTARETVEAYREVIDNV
ncbi:Glycosyltransferase involved in cell wall bisynthesis [Haladaptatus litoreus]|uniref:Glycosyltransferase involved in cell wall bisynthesis n=1 Tax=Haladaptatus litoreus TaxID=553468 RepID=A0A1N7DC44_9EURY|nr:glycosyltransferase family 1 protein [Haladaptatus litoreus]SIR73327.1 Glycosyltransferase involved in cell wall bisynthesis [Haladaptatus litoreus]